MAARYLLPVGLRSSRDEGVVERNVALRARVPAEVARHPVLLQLTPDLLVVVRLDRSRHPHCETVTAHWFEQKTGGSLVRQVYALAVDHGIVQPSRVMRHRRRAVALAIHLVQPARLEPRGHQE